MIYRISHRSSYLYTLPVSVSHHVLHLAPRDCGWQVNRSHAVTVHPAPAVSRSGMDYFGNPTTFLTVQERHTNLVFHAESTIEVLPRERPDPAATVPWEGVYPMLSADSSDEGLETFQFAFPSPFTAAPAGLAEYALESFTPGRPILEAALDLTRRIHRDFRYDPEATTVSTPLAEVLAARHGVCQDFAHLEIAALRELGLPARYVSGYLRTRPPAGRDRLVGADASHAWLALWCPGHGWIDLDPTNNLVPGIEHITIAWGRDYGDVSPVRGVIVGGGDHEVEVAVDVRPIEAKAAPAAAHASDSGEAETADEPAATEADAPG